MTDCQFVFEQWLMEGKRRRRGELERKRQMEGEHMLYPGGKREQAEKIQPEKLGAKAQLTANEGSLKGFQQLDVFAKHFL